MQNADRERASREFCDLFLRPNRRQKFILGRNVYAKSVVQSLELDGIIDDFTKDVSYEGLPVIRTNEIPKDALVLNAAGGRPLSAREQLDRLGIQNLDYFTFLRLTELPLHDVVFNEGFPSEYKEHLTEYQWIYERFADDRSQAIFNKLVGFRSSLDITYLEGFKTNESVQYFEDFLELGSRDEVFVDVGCFDGSNSLEFARLAPKYRAIHAFEPDPTNFATSLRNLQGLHDVHLYKMGLSDSSATLGFSPDGSGSKISNTGAVTVVVNRLDDIIEDSPTFIKMDIEGAEHAALNGAARIIANSHPRLAISVYHKAGDFHRIPRLVLSVRDDYDIHLRHYTESIYETVMFFIPRT